MTEATEGDDTPTVATDESTETEDNPTDAEKAPEAARDGLDEIARELTALKDELGQGQADALHALTEGCGIESPSELYQEIGHNGETLTIEIEVYEAELEQLIALLEAATTGRMDVQYFLPRCQLLSEVLNEAVTPQMLARWDRTDWSIPEVEEDNE